MVTVEELIEDLSGLPGDSPILLHTLSGYRELGAIALTSVPVDDGMMAVVLFLSSELPEEVFEDLHPLA